MARRGAPEFPPLPGGLQLQHPATPRHAASPGHECERAAVRQRRHPRHDDVTRARAARAPRRAGGGPGCRSSARRPRQPKRQPTPARTRPRSGVGDTAASGRNAQGDGRSRERERKKTHQKKIHPPAASNYHKLCRHGRNMSRGRKSRFEFVREME